MSVAEFGFHRDEDGMWWLLQGDTVQSAVNLPASACPFDVSMVRGRSATDLKLVPKMDHNEPLATQIKRDPVARYFLPTTERLRPLFVRATVNENTSVTRAVLAMTALQSPVVPVAHSEWMGKDIAKRMSKLNSNFVTTVLYGGYTPGGAVIRQMTEYATMTDNRLVIVGTQEPDSFNRDLYDTFDASENGWNCDYRKMPPSADVMRYVGGHLAYQFMRGELND